MAAGVTVAKVGPTPKTYSMGCWSLPAGDLCDPSAVLVDDAADGVVEAGAALAAAAVVLSNLFQSVGC